MFTQRSKRRVVAMAVEAMEARRMLSAGDLDLTFGVGGKVVHDSHLIPTGLAIQSDGKILFSGWGYGDSASVARLNPNGTPDLSFGVMGVAHADVGGYGAFSTGLDIGPAGKIAVSGHAYPYQPVDDPGTATLVVYGPGGHVDTSFSGDGAIQTNAYGTTFNDVAFQGDGKVVVVGNKVVRFKADGTPDASFSGDGVIDVGGRKVLVDGSGRIVVLGYYAIFRFNADGTPDATFDGDGVLPNVKALDLALAPDGDIVVAGNGPNGNLVSRFNADGTVDQAFGNRGNATAPGKALAVTAGNIFVGGDVTATIPPSGQTAVYALTPSGQVDLTFGQGGRVVLPADTVSAPLVALAASGDKLLALGTANVPLEDLPGMTEKRSGLVRLEITGGIPMNPQQPFGTAPIALPGIVEAEAFDRGGEGIAYHDTDLANLGGAFRTGDCVDVQAAGNGYVVGFVKAGEWLEYTVDAGAGGKFDVDFVVSHLRAGGKFHLEVDGKDVTGAMAVPKTGDWAKYVTVTKAGVSLTAGRHVLRVAFDVNGEIGYVGNFDRIGFRAVTDGQRPFGDVAYTDGQRVESENYDRGGEGVAYHDVDAANLGGAYRAEGVDVQVTTDAGGGYNVGFLKTGEWLEYTMDFTQGGPFDLNVRVASQGNSGTFRVLVDGQAVGTFTTPHTGGWQSWRTLSKSGVNVAAGRHVVRFQMDSAGPTGFTVNLNWFEFKKA
jgi:uncharacterized delta-60 repeat protein